tara:strand:- start:1187 stop:1729 length:543 start_codon:yes stop_codon:yes gene_type:complete
MTSQECTGALEGSQECTDALQQKLRALAGSGPDGFRQAYELARTLDVRLRLSGLDLSGIGRALVSVGDDLSGVSLRETDLRFCNLTRTNLAGADLWGADLTCSHLVEVDLRGASLWCARLVLTGFVRCDLRGADLRHTDLACASFVECIFDDDTDGAEARDLLLQQPGADKARKGVDVSD